ncbi:MAG: DUF4294 domain-containing protein [Bacteroidia bacterium]|nr:DUF4294 domain-containing protein [Bacteroidia bacterium]
MKQFLTNLFLIFGCILFFQLSFAQKVDGVRRLPYIIEDGDTIPVVNLSVVTIIDSLDPDYYKKLQAYYRLRFNVMKVYPYSRLLAVKLHEINEHLATLQTKRERRQFMREAEEGIKKDFENDLKNFSVSQGKVFTKLVDRETGHTSFELIKELRGSLRAFFWQNFALIFGQNLKVKYDPNGDDVVIESIVRQIEEGKLQ